MAHVSQAREWKCARKNGELPMAADDEIRGGGDMRRGDCWRVDEVSGSLSFKSPANASMSQPCNPSCT